MPRRRRVSPTPFTADEPWEKGHIYSYALMSNFRTNFSPRQTGDLLLRYALTTGEPGDLTFAQSTGYRAHNPLYPVVVRGPQQGALSPAASLVSVSDPGVVLTCLKAADDGAGVILRLWDGRGLEGSAEVRLVSLDIEQAWRADLVERIGEPLAHDQHSVRVPMTPHGTTTVRLKTRQQWPAVEHLWWD